MSSRTSLPHSGAIPTQLMTWKLPLKRPSRSEPIASRFRQAGVTRFLMGYRRLDALTERLGRIPLPSQRDWQAFVLARNDIRTAFSFGSIIYGRQNQTLVDWQGRTEPAPSLAIDHMVFVPIAIDMATAFGDRYGDRKACGLPLMTLVPICMQANPKYLRTRWVCILRGVLTSARGTAPNRGIPHYLAVRRLSWVSAPGAGVDPEWHRLRDE